MCILKHKNVVVNRSDIVRSASALFQFYIKIKCSYGCRKVGRGLFDLVLQIVTNFGKKNLPFYLNLYAQVVGNIFCHDGHREIIIVVITNDRVLYGLYSVLFIDR